MKLVQGNVGRVTLDSSTVLSTDSFTSAPKPLCAFNIRDEPQPVVMQVSCGVQPTNVTQPNLATGKHLISGLHAVGAPGVTIEDIFASLFVTYGAGQARPRQAIFDLKQGSYQLPPCTNVQVAWRAFRKVAGTPPTIPITLEVALVPGQHMMSPTRPVYTAGQSITGASGYTILVPTQARWWDIWADAPTTLTAASPTIAGKAATANAAHRLYRDYVTGTYSPPWGPAELGAQDNDQLTVSNTNAAMVATNIWTRFWLEL